MRLRLASGAILALALFCPPAAAQLASGEIVVVDRDADPDNLGGDTGAVFRVDPDDGSVSPLATSTAFVNPQGVAIDAEGRIVVADGSADPEGLGGNTGAVFRFWPGEEPRAIGTSAQFFDPWGVAIDHSGRILVTDYGGGNVFRFAPGDAPAVIATTFTMPAGIAVDAAGNILVADRNANPTQSGEVFRFAPGDPPVELTRSDLFSDPTGVAVDAAGRILVADPDSDPDASGLFAGAIFRSVPGDVPAPVITGGAMTDPFDVAVDSQGRALIADSSGKVLRALPGEPPATLATSQFVMPHGIAVNAVAPAPPDDVPPPEELDTIAPELKRLSLSRDRFRSVRARGKAAAKSGTRISYRLSEPATLRFTVQRRSGKKGLLKGGFADAGEAGTNRLRFDGVLGRRKLAAGRYRLLATATDPAGNVSSVKSARFTIIEGTGPRRK